MSDAIDTAQEQEAIFLNVALSKRKPTLNYTGFCHWCKELVVAKAHFCDADCRHDFEQNRRLNGGW